MMSGLRSIGPEFERAVIGWRLSRGAQAASAATSQNILLLIVIDATGTRRQTQVTILKMVPYKPSQEELDRRKVSFMLQFQKTSELTICPGCRH